MKNLIRRVAYWLRRRRLEDVAELAESTIGHCRACDHADTLFWVKGSFICMDCWVLRRCDPWDYDLAAEAKREVVG